MLTFRIDTPGAVSSLDVIRAGDRAYHYRSDAHCRIRTLSPLDLENDVEFYEVRLPPDGALRSAAHYDGTREFVTVQNGRVARTCPTPSSTPAARTRWCSWWISTGRD